jgi:16S rRNA (adenine1518-N6/adenine1519-N6)-dimethyltransferase
LGEVEGGCTASNFFKMVKNLSGGDSSELLSVTRKLLRRFDLKAKKGLGQHFLIDADVLESIIEAAELTREDTVIEVGPGLGILTAELAKRAGWVIAIELDARLARVLKKMLPYDNIVVMNEDVLGTDPSEILKGKSPHVPAVMRSYKVVANLPYYITSPVLRHFLEATVKPEVMVVMVQKEVAEAILAGPGKMGLLSLSVQFYGRPALVTVAPAGTFYPPPEVDSAVVKIDVYRTPPVDVTDTGGFFRLARAGFAAPRKQAANSLAQGLKLPREAALEMLAAAGIEPRRRAETFTLDEWAALWRAFEKRENG